MTQTSYLQTYLPLERDLDFHIEHTLKNFHIETQAGTLHPSLDQENPLNTLFTAKNIEMTEAEMQALKHFYHLNYMQRFLLKPPPHAETLLLITNEDADNQRINFTLQASKHLFHYWHQHAIILVDDIIQHDTTLNINLELEFPEAPLVHNAITVDIAYDHIVRFNYAYGLHSIADQRNKTHKVSFQLVR